MFGRGSPLVPVTSVSALLATSPTLSRKRIVVLASCLVMAVGRAAVAQSIHDRLAGVKTLNCNFTTNVVATWKNGTPQTEIKPAKLTMRFESVNTDEGTARVVGMFGPSDIIVRLSENTLHLIQSFREGPLYVTTVFPRDTLGGRLQAVHTRHEWTDVTLPGYTSSPEQYYGDCEVSP